MASWAGEIARRIEEIESGEAKLIPMEVTMAKLRAVIERAPRREPRIPSGLKEIEDHALHLPDDDFYLLLVNLEAALPEQVDSAWRAAIKLRIAAIPV